MAADSQESTQVGPGQDPQPGDEIIERAVRKLQAGAGPAAFEPIYRRYYRPLYVFFANRPALRDDAHDLAQETLLRAYEKIHQYGFRASFSAWLRRIGQNTWKNAVRQRQPARFRSIEEEKAYAGNPHGEPTEGTPLFTAEGRTPEQEAIERERAEVLQEAIAALPPGMRRCTELRLGHDLQYQEIADVMSIGLNSVRSQLFAARKRLRPVLDRYFPDADF